MHEKHSRHNRWSSPRQGARCRHWSGHRSHGRGGHRARRGDVRAAVLALLDEQPMHGYEMIKELEARSGGAWRPSAGSIYPTLQLLEDEGLIKGEETGGKRRFTLTDEGKAEAGKRSGATPWEEVTAGVDPRQLQFREAILQLRAAVQQIARAGNAEQAGRARDVLDEARKALYGILAEDAPAE
jgi:DNA-binding PadR family transcriptional regulator